MSVHKRKVDKYSLDRWHKEVHLQCIRDERNWQHTLQSYIFSLLKSIVLQLLSNLLVRSSLLPGFIRRAPPYSYIWPYLLLLTISLLLIPLSHFYSNISKKIWLFADSKLNHYVVVCHDVLPPPIQFHFEIDEFIHSSIWGLPYNVRLLREYR